MAKAKSGEAASNEPHGLLGELARLRGNTAGIDPREIDGVMLWYAVVALAQSSTSIQIGLTKDKSSWATQLWQGQYPVKDYFSTTEALNKHLAALVRLGWKVGLPAEVEDRVRGYGW